MSCCIYNSSQIKIALPKISSYFIWFPNSKLNFICFFQMGGWWQHTQVHKVNWLKIKKKKKFNLVTIIVVGLVSE
jgi:hypothetical protein